MTVVIPYNENDWQRAERLLDGIYWIGLCKPVGHCLLVCDSTVHKEYQTKVKLAAEVAFSTVDQIEAHVPAKVSKIMAINSVFNRASHYISQTYKEPWLWLEADNVPVKATWLKELFKAYDKQPKRFMGRFMKASAGTFMSRTGIYPHDAHRDLDTALKGEPPFERVANILNRCTTTSLIHMEKWRPDIQLPEDVVLLNGDRSGQLIETLIARADVKPKKVKVIA